LPSMEFGGLLSEKDGRLDPLKLLKCFQTQLNKNHVETINEKVVSLERGVSQSKNRWIIHLSSGSNVKIDTVVICAALGSDSLLQPLGHNYPIEPVLGQATDLQLSTTHKNWSGWPAVVVSKGINLIPTDDNQILVGATLEPGEKPNITCKENIKNLNGAAPNWLKKASIKSNWHGLRGRPIQKPAPILENLESGLILATGHYRNGILLAPASAEWISNEINKSENI